MKDDSLLSRGHMELLEKTGRALQGAVEVEAVTRTTLRSVVPTLADMAALVTQDGQGNRRLQVSHARSSQTSRLEREVLRALDAVVESAEASAREGRLARWVPEVTSSSARLLTRGDDRLGGLLHALDVHSLIVVSLRSGGRTLGGLALARSNGSSRYQSSDFATVQVLARRVAVALDAALLRQDLQDRFPAGPVIAGALEKWVRVFDAACSGAAVVDGMDLRLDAVNPAFARLHGYDDADALIGRSFTELLPAERAGELEQWWSGSPGVAYESEHRRFDGGTVPVLVSVTPLDDEPQPRSYAVTVQDLSDLKRAEERLRRAQRMEAVGRLAGGVAHEVNNMMTIILGFSDLLGRGAQSPDDQRREVEEIRKAALRAGKITAQLLAFSRQRDLQPTNLRLTEVVGEMAPVLRLMLPANVRVETALAPLDIQVRVDRSQLEQVLINLAFNARDAMAAGGTIRIATESRWLDRADGLRLIGIPIPPGLYGLVSVIDTGHGMDPATLSQVFEPFFTTKPVGSGTGLGLSTVYGIVKQSGGYVWAESTPGQGTTFTLCLPEVTEGAKERHTALAPEPALEARGETVLILEDEDGVRELAARVLRARGYRVLLARNGAEALARLRNDTAGPNLLLTDVVVPDMGTEELEWEVHHLLPELPILYMSGYPMDDILARGLLRSDQPFLQKPFTSEDLAREVGRVIHRA